jgi:hypothetical protein
MSWEYLITTIGPRLGRRKLPIEEVTSSGAPAAFQAFGESLLYLEGRVFDLRHDGSPAGERLCPTMLDPAVLRYAVGIEYGWQHVEGCRCETCLAHHAQREAA